MNKIKIAFVGQPEYFRCLYETDLNKHYEVKEYAINMGGTEIERFRRYQDLLKDESDIMFFFRGEFVPHKILKDIKALKIQLSSEPIPTLKWSTEDRNSRFEALCANKNMFDHFFHYDKTNIPFLEKQGFKVDGEFIFPVATNFYEPIKTDGKFGWDVGFFGRSTQWREVLLGIPKRDFNVLHVAHGMIGRWFKTMLSHCKMGLNLHVDALPSLEHRMQNMMACGLPVISESLTHNDCLKPGKHFIELDLQNNPKDLIEKLTYYLDNVREREKIARAGFEFVKDNLNSVACFKRLIGGILK